MGNKLQHSGEVHADTESGTRRSFLSSVVSAAVLVPRLFAQRQAPSDLAETFRRMSADYERKGLAEPFKGITTDGNIVPGLFEIRPTGVPTEPVRLAAQRFLSTLASAQLSRTLFTVDDPEWRKWMNQHFYVRQGVSFQEMTQEQREAALNLMRASFSSRGFELTRNIMRLNETLAELTDDHEFLGEWLYYFTIMGRPSAGEPWGWQLDGHHAILNYFVMADQVVATPLFLGSEPVRATSGKYQGVTVLQQEQNDGLSMLKTLPDALRRKAILTLSKIGNNNLTEAFKDNVVLDYAGLPTAELDTAARSRLLDLVELYVGNMDDGHARVKMDEVKHYLEDTWFAWIGGTETGSAFYYRIQSPVILIEFDHQRPANLTKFSSDPKKPTQQHIHCVVRTPNGNDYGKDLLRQHYLSHSHKI